MLAISLMKLILVARNAFEAYLIISAVRMSVLMIGGSGCRSRYRPATRSMASGSVPPSTTRSGWRKSSTAEPSRRNSGLLTTRKRAPEPLLARSSAGSIQSPVPIGMVLLLTTIRLRSDGVCSPRLCAAALTWLMSASPSMPDGVPTHTNANWRSAQTLDVVQREAQAARLDVLDDDLFQARLVDWQLAAPEPLHFARVDVDAHDLVAQLREAGGGDQPNIIGADDGDIGHYFGV